MSVFGPWFQARTLSAIRNLLLYPDAHYLWIKRRSIPWLISRLIICGSISIPMAAAGAAQRRQRSFSSPPFLESHIRRAIVQCSFCTPADLVDFDRPGLWLPWGWRHASQDQAWEAPPHSQPGARTSWHLTRLPLMAPAPATPPGSWMSPAPLRWIALAAPPGIWLTLMTAQGTSPTSQAACQPTTVTHATSRPTTAPEEATNAPEVPTTAPGEVSDQDIGDFLDEATRIRFRNQCLCCRPSPGGLAVRGNADHAADVTDQDGAEAPVSPVLEYF